MEWITHKRLWRRATSEVVALHQGCCVVAHVWLQEFVNLNPLVVEALKLHVGCFVVEVLCVMHIRCSSLTSHSKHACSGSQRVRWLCLLAGSQAGFVGLCKGLCASCMHGKCVHVAGIVGCVFCSLLCVKGSLQRSVKRRILDKARMLKHAGSVSGCRL